MNALLHRRRFATTATAAIAAAAALTLVLLCSVATVAAAGFNYTVISTPGAGSPRAFPDSATTLLVRGDDTLTIQAQIGFAFTFYGRTYTNVSVGTNGILQFETSTANTNGPFPSNIPMGGEDQFWPAIAAYWTDLDSSNAGNMTSATLGTAPNRVFVVRIFQVLYYGLTANVTIDVELYETSNVIQVHYFSLYYPPDPDSQLTIGLCSARHGDFSLETLIIANTLDMNSNNTALLNGTTLTFTPSLPVAYVSTAAAPARSARGAYKTIVTHSPTPLTLAALLNATTLAPSPNVITLPLGMTFTLYGVNYTSVKLYALGVLEFGPFGPFGNALSLDTVLPTTTSAQPFVAFALASWTMGASTGTISYATVNDTAGRSFHLRYNAVPHASSADSTITCEVVLYERSSSIEVRYVSVPIVYGSIVVGMQSALIAPNAINVTDQYEYAVVANNLIMADSVANYLTNTIVRFVNCTVCSDPVDSSSVVPSSSVMPSSSVIWSSSAVPINTGASTSSSTLSSGAIAGIVVAVVVSVVALLAFAVCFWSRTKTSNAMMGASSPTPATGRGSADQPPIAVQPVQVDIEMMERETNAIV